MSSPLFVPFKFIEQVPVTNYHLDPTRIDDMMGRRVDSILILQREKTTEDLSRGQWGVYPQSLCSGKGVPNGVFENGFNVKLPPTGTGDIIDPKQGRAKIR